MVKCPGMGEKDTNDTAQQRAYRAFESLIAAEDGTIDLAQAALLIACIAYPDLDMAHYLAQLDQLAGRVQDILASPQPETAPELLAGVEPLTTIQAINTILFTEDDFHGNLNDYYNPDNSFLNKVIESHVGIPITLSLLYIEVARRVGLQADGIGLPFHFVVGCRLPQGNRIYIDAFEHGQILSEQECRDRIRQMSANRIKFHAQWFEPVTHKQLILRMLTNLKHIYMHKEEYTKALAICDRIVLLVPNSPSERRDRGIIHLQLKHYARAIHDLKAYTELAPRAEDRDEMLEHIKTIRQTMALMN
jgi:regulator of sirC expression with transglutaminase-like and TPR domain